MVWSSVALSTPLSGCAVASLTRTKPSWSGLNSELLGWKKLASSWVPSQLWSKSGGAQRLGSWKEKTRLPLSSRLEFAQDKVLSALTVHVSPSTQTESSLLQLP